MLNQKIHTCHFENCEVSSDLESSLKQHITKKHGPTENYDSPSMSYAQLITEALNNTWEKTLVLSDICKAINNKYPYYELETQGWQNSIRHVLTVNKKFVRGEAKSGLVDNRGGYWKLTEDHSISAPKVQKRENQSLNKQDLDIQTTHVTKVKAKVKSTDAEIDLIQLPGSSDIDLIDLTATEQEDIGGRRCKEEFTCPYCEIVFDSKNEFTEHVVLHVEGYPCQTGGRNVKCLIPKCDAFFWTDGDMKQHLTKTHKMTKKL